MLARFKDNTMSTRIKNGVKTVTVEIEATMTAQEFLEFYTADFTEPSFHLEIKRRKYDEETPPNPQRN